MCTSFAEKGASAKWGSEDKITSPAIAAKFEAVSGTEMHGIVAWREWCTLERCLADDTLAWLAIHSQMLVIGFGDKHIMSVSCFRCNLQVYASGQMVVFNKNALEVAVKVKIFKKYDVGLQSDYQVAMLANLSSFFKV